MKEIYVCYDPLESGIIKELLTREGVGCVVRDMRITPYPLTIGSFGEMRVLVGEEDVRVALKLLRQAREDGVISRTGKFKEELPRAL